MSRFNTYARPRTIDGRSASARTARVSGGEFDINGNLLGGRDQMTGQRVQGPSAPGGLDLAAQRLGWNQPKASRYQAALAEGRQPAVPVANAGRDQASGVPRKAANIFQPQDGAEAARGAHNAQVTGSSPVPATNSTAAAPANGAANADQPDWLHQAGAFLGNAAGHALTALGRYGRNLFGMNGQPEGGASQPGVPVSHAEQDQPSGSVVTPEASVSAPFNPTAAMHGEFAQAGWAQPGDETTHDGAGYQVNGQSVQPTGRMAMSVWEKQNGVAGMGTQARPGQRFSEKGQAIMNRTTPPVERGEYVTDANGQRVREGYTSKPAVAQSLDRSGQPTGSTTGYDLGDASGRVTGRAIEGAYGSGTSRFNVPAGAPVLHDGPGGQQVVTRQPLQTTQTDFPRLASPDSARPDDDEEEAKRRGRYAGSLMA